MPIIDINLPGSSSKVTVDAKGFASEESLQRLIDALTGSTSASAKNAKELNKEMKSSTANLGDLGEETIDLTQDFEDAGYEVSQLAKAGRLAKDAFNEARHGANRLADAGASGSVSLTGTVDIIRDVGTTVFDAIGEVIKGIPLVGQAIAGLTTGLGSTILKVGAGAAGFVLGQLEALREQQRQLFDSGVYFARGIDDAAKIADDAGVTIQVLSKTAAEASTSLRLFQGGAATGLRKVAGAFKIIDDTSKMQLYSLGYTQDEILASIADFGAAASMAGKNLSTEELAAESTGYLKNLAELSRITGTDIKSRRAAAEQLQREASFQKYLRGLNGDQARYVSDIIAALPESQRELAKANLMGVQIINDTALAYQQANSQGSRSVMQNLDAMARAGLLTKDSMEKTAKQYGEVVNEETTAIADGFGSYQMLYYMEQSTGVASNILKNLGSTAFDAKQMAEASRAGAESFDLEKTTEEIKTNANSLNSSIAKLTEVETELASKLQTVTFKMTAYATQFVDNLASLVDRMGKELGINSTGLPARQSLSSMPSGAVLTQGRGGMGGGRGGNQALTAEQKSQADQFNFLKSLNDEQLRNEGWRKIDGGYFGQDKFEKMALGGIVPDFGPQGKTVTVGDGTAEAIVPLPNGRSIPVDMRESQAFKDMNSKLDLVASISRAMLDAMEENNRLVRQGNQLVS